MTTRDGIRSLRPAAAALALLAAAATPAAEADLFLAFTPDPALEQDAGSLSPEGCYNEPAVARGALTASSSTTNCHSGQWGSDSNVDNCGGGVCEPFDQSEAIFDSAPVSAPLQLDGTATLVAYYYAAYERGPGGTNDPDLPTTAYLEYAIEDFTPGAIGGVTIARGRAFQLNGQAGGVHRGEATFSIASYAIPAGHILRVRLTSQAAPDGRLLFGGAPLASTPAFGARSEYSDAGITFGTPDSKSDGGALGAGSMPGGPLALLALLALLRGRSFQPRARANSFMYSTSAFTPASGIAL